MESMFSICLEGIGMASNTILKATGDFVRSSIHRDVGWSMLDVVLPSELL